MIVSFDLDETLFVSEEKFETEPKLKFPLNTIYKEKLRAGTVELMKYIHDQNIGLWIYTDSYRSERYIRGLFNSYGIKLDNIINGERHAAEVQAGRTESMPSKYPSKYHIDLHIDDDPAVYRDGKNYGFNVFVVGGQDDEWTDKIKKEIERIRKMLQLRNSNV